MHFVLISSPIQDREKASSAALESARKEIQDLKNIISKNEEEKQARDATISGLEKRVAELDQKLQEALHNEVCVSAKFGWKALPVFYTLFMFLPLCSRVAILH